MDRLERRGFVVAFVSGSGRRAVLFGRRTGHSFACRTKRPAHCTGGGLVRSRVELGGTTLARLLCGLAQVRCSRSRRVRPRRATSPSYADDPNGLGRVGPIVDRSTPSVRVFSRADSLCGFFEVGRGRFGLSRALEVGSGRPPRGMGVRLDGAAIRPVRSCAVLGEVGSPVASRASTLDSQRI
jgi:hypothetical protein